MAVIGGGPAGLSCAYQLTLKGHEVTVFDEHEHLGGMMRYGIPGFRTPREVLDAEIQRILDLGVKTRMNCRVGTDITMEQIRKEFDAVFLGMGAQAGRALPIADSEAPQRGDRDGLPEGLQRRPSAACRQARGGGRRRRHLDRRGHGGAPPWPYRQSPRNGPMSEHAIAGQIAHDVAEISAKQGAEVTLTSIFAIDKMQANKHEIEQALAEGIAIRGGMAPIGIVRGADGRATALRVSQCEAKMVGGKLEVKNIEGTEEDIPADLIVSAIGQAVDFTGLEEFNNGKGAINADKNYQVPGQPGVFVGGDVMRPHLLTTAIGHGSIAADGIDRFLRRGAGKASQDRRAPIRPDAQDDGKRLYAKRSARAQSRHRQEQRRHPQLRQPLRPLCDPARRTVPGALPYVARNRRNVITLTQSRRWATSRSACRRCWRRRRWRKPSAA